MADSTDDTNFFWQSKYGSSERFSNIVDGSDALANGGKFVVSFQHIASGKEVFFKAFVTRYAENFNSNWKNEVVYGRTDPIYTYANTRRTVNFGFEVPASSEQEAYENMGRIQKLSQMVYPTYENTGGQYLITQSPLVRIKVMNLLTSNTVTNLTKEDAAMTRRRFFGRYRSNGNPDADGGVLAAINNLSFDTDFKQTSVFEVGPNVILPQNFTVNIDFAVIHEKTTGYDLEGNPLNPGLPFDVTLKPPSAKEKVKNRATYEKRLQLQADQQAAEDIAAVRFNGALGGRRAQRAVNRYDRKLKKGKANDFDAALADEAKNYLDSE